MLKTFSLGGIHPADKKLTADKTVIEAPLPQTVYIPCSQHIGAPAEIIVAKGDKVVVGQLIAKAKGFVSANIHSSVSGTVMQIGNIPDAGGTPKQGVIINVEGDQWLENIDLNPEINRNISNVDKNEIINRVTSAGVVGMGGATFPTNVKLSVPLEKKADTVIINGVECEPYLTADHRVMIEKGEQVLIGAQLIKKAVGADIAYIGIENNKPDAIKHLKELSSGLDGISIVPLKMKYPQGGEKQLIKAVTGREVKSGRLPIDEGAVVQNAETALAIYEAVQKNMPLIKRVVTVSGDSVKNPGNFLVRIGTPIKELIELAGGLPEDTGKIILGGPMMGKAVTDLNIPVIKGTSGITILTQQNSKRREVQNCIKCGRCVQACPMGLEPYLISVYSKNQMFDLCEQNYITDCIECGCCMFSCPASRPLLDYMRLGKRSVMNIIKSRTIKK